MHDKAPNRLDTWLTGAGILLLAYAVLGNYVALPGYVRFLKRGGTSAAGNALDLSVVIGATKTILWMYSFQLGVLALALVHSRREALYTKQLAVAAIVWLALWSWPSLPAPGAWFYLLFGGMILVGIVLKLRQPQAVQRDRLGRTLFLGAIVFFAFATWEVCGLGSTGRILHSEQAAQPVAHNIVVTQSSKLMIEFLLAWGLLVTSGVAARTARA